MEGKDCVVAAWSNLHPAECIHSSKFKMADFEGDEIVDYRDDEGNEDLQPSESYSGSSADVVEPEQFKQRVLEMEEELEKLTKMEQQVEKQITSATDKIDETSMYVYIFFKLSLARIDPFYPPVTSVRLIMKQRLKSSAHILLPVVR